MVTDAPLAAVLPPLMKKLPAVLKGTTPTAAHGSAEPAAPVNVIIWDWFVPAVPAVAVKTTLVEVAAKSTKVRAAKIASPPPGGPPTVLPSVGSLAGVTAVA